jgi:citrate synthase
MVKAGLEDVVAQDSNICFLDGIEGRLKYRGYDIHDLAEKSTFEEVVYLLWFGKLPTEKEMDYFARDLRVNRTLPDHVIRTMRRLPKRAQPMDMLRTIVSMLAMYDPDFGDNSREATIRKATRLTARFPTIIANFDNIRNDKEPREPREDCNLAANFLYLLSGKKPDEFRARALDKSLILHADHEFNASTFSARVTASTETDLHSAITAAIGTLKGPLHGGANQEVIKMFLQIEDPARAEAYVMQRLAEKKKIMGFGHRVYRTEDPRACILRQASEEMSKRLNQMKWFEMSRIIEDLVLREKHIYANLDFYSASVYYLLGIPTDLFTPIFAMSRVSGWTAHVLEQNANNRLIRPRAQYTGPNQVEYVPIDKR